MSLAILGIGPLEWLVLLGGAVMLFGGDLPGKARKAAQFIGKWRAMVRDLSREMDLHSTPTPPPPLPPAPEDEDDWEPDTGVDADAPQPEGAPDDEDASHDDDAPRPDAG